MGGSVTAEYWQFVPHGDTIDIASLASQQGKDGSQTPLSGLQTPPSAFERRRDSMHQLARATSQPSLAESPSPVNSIYLQRQSSALPPHPDTIPYINTNQHCTTSRTLHQALSPPSEIDAMPAISSDSLRNPATASWQHQQESTPLPSYQQPSFLSSSQRQWSNTPGSLLEPSQCTQQQQQQQQQHQHPAAIPVFQQETRGHGIAPTSLLQQTGLVPEPPSASWSREVPRDSSLDLQMHALNFSSLAIAAAQGPSGEQLIK